MKTHQLTRLEHLAFTEFIEMAEDAVFDPDYPANGSFHQRQRGSHTYWYYQRHTGMSASGKQVVESRYVGKVGNPAIEERIADFGRIKEQRRIRRRLIAMLRHAGLPSPRPEDQEIVTALAHAGIFKAGGVLIGPMAFQSYCGLLGTRMASAVGSDEHDDEHAIIVPPGSELSHITPKTLRGTDSLPIVRLEAYAGDALGLTQYLVDQSVRSALICDDAISVRVPDPARYAICKIVLTEVSTPRKPNSKSSRDRVQIEDLIGANAAAGRTVELAEAWGLIWHHDLKARRALIKGTLGLAPETITLLGSVCYRFGEEPFSSQADPVGTLRAAL